MFWKLAWADRWVKKLDVEVEGVPDGAPSPVVFSAEGTTVLFKFTADEFMQVYTAILNGADLTYGATSTQVLWYFLRNVEYPLEFCEQIINCILNDADTQAALVSTVLNSPEFEDYIGQLVKGLTTAQITGPLISGSCDNSVLAGKMLELVERLDTNNKDAIEIIEVGTNDEEKAAALLEGIPIADELPFGDVIDFAQDILEDFGENYDAASTIDRREQTAQDLYCLAKSKPDCVLTYGDLFDYFQNKAVSGLTLGSLIIDIAQFAATGDFDTDDAIFYGLMALQVAAIRTGQEFFGINAPKIAALTRDADPSSIWEEWGDCSSEWCRHLDASNDLGTLFVGTGGLGAQAIYSGGMWIANNALISSRITLEADMLANYTIDTMRVVYSGTPTATTPNIVGWYYDHFAGAIDDAPFTDDVMLTGPVTLQKFDLDTVSSFDNSVPITVGITDIYISGTGAEPTWGEPC